MNKSRQELTKKEILLGRGNIVAKMHDFVAMKKNYKIRKCAPTKLSCSEESLTMARPSPKKISFLVLNNKTSLRHDECNYKGMFSSSL